MRCVAGGRAANDIDTACHDRIGHEHRGDQHERLAADERHPYKYTSKCRPRQILGASGTYTEQVPRIAPPRFTAWALPGRRASACGLPSRSSDPCDL